MAQVTIMTGPERRRRWGEGDRREILAAAFAPGAVVADVSRRYEISTSLIYKWRRQVIAAHAAPSFVPAVMVDHAVVPERPAMSDPMILVELAGGTRVTFGAGASSSAITATLRTLR